MLLSYNNHQGIQPLNFTFLIPNAGDYNKLNIKRDKLNKEKYIENMVLKNTGIDQDIIDTNDINNLNYWSTYFSIHSDKLIEAAAIVAPSIAALHMYFQKQVSI